MKILPITIVKSNNIKQSFPNSKNNKEQNNKQVYAANWANFYNNQINFQMAKLPDYIFDKNFKINNVNDVKELLDNKTDNETSFLLTRKNEHNDTLLSLAIKNQDLESLNYILDKASKLDSDILDKILFQETGHDESNAFKKAIDIGNQEIIDSIIGFLKEKPDTILSLLMSQNKEGIETLNTLISTQDVKTLNKILNAIDVNNNEDFLLKETQYRKRILLEVLCSFQEGCDVIPTLFNKCNTLTIDKMLSHKDRNKNGAIDILIAQRTHYETEEEKQKLESKIAATAQYLIDSASNYETRKEMLTCPNGSFDLLHTSINKKNKELVRIIAKNLLRNDILNRDSLTCAFVLTKDDKETQKILLEELTKGEKARNMIVSILLDVNFDKAIEDFNPEVLKNALLFNDNQANNRYALANKNQKEKLAVKLATETQEINIQDSIKLLEKYAPEEKDYINYLRAISE